MSLSTNMSLTSRQRDYLEGTMYMGMLLRCQVLCRAGMKHLLIKRFYLSPKQRSFVMQRVVKPFRQRGKDGFADIRLHTYHTFPLGLECVAFHPFWPLMAFSERHGKKVQLVRMDAANMSYLATLEYGWAKSIVFSSMAPMIAIGNYSGNIVLWFLDKTYQKQITVTTLRAHQGSTTVALHPTIPGFMASASDDVKFWQIVGTDAICTEAHSTPEFEKGSRKIEALAWHPNGPFIFAGDNFGRIEVLEITPANQIVPKAQHKGVDGICEIVVSPNLPFIFTGGTHGDICLWTIEHDFTGVSLLRSYPAYLKGTPYKCHIRSLALYGPFLVSGSSEGRTILWKIDPTDLSLSMVKVLCIHNSSVHSAVSSLHGFIAAVTKEGILMTFKN
jgi:WD40 repeat protein